MEIIRSVNFVLSILFIICYSYQFFYILAAWFGKKKTADHAPHNNKFAVLICARNESAVIGGLLESIREQTYDQSKLTVFVLADNCTDDTAQTARSAGAAVYERFNTELIGKSYALSELIAHIAADYGDDAFDGYFVFDADNLLKKDYIEKMNDVFSQGYSVVTSYRNSKNFGDNWLSSGMGLWFLRESRYLNYARDLLKVSCALSGTGYLFRKEALNASADDPWPFHTLTEDLEMTFSLVSRNIRIAFADAEFFDEQPATIKQSWNQRIRWSKGYFQAMRIHGLSILKGLFSGSFSCYDLVMNYVPALVFSVATLICNTVFLALTFITYQDPLVVLRSFGEIVFNAYATVFSVGAITTFSEWKHIRSGAVKKIWHMFTFPVYMFTFLPITLAAVFKKNVVWKPIVHTVTKEEFEKKSLS